MKTNPEACTSCAFPLGKKRGTLSLHLGTKKIKLKLCGVCNKDRSSLDEEQIARILKARGFSDAEVDTATAQVRGIVRKTKNPKTPPNPPFIRAA